MKGPSQERPSQWKQQLFLQENSVYSNRKAEWNTDCQGETFLGCTQAALLFLTDRPGFGASLSLKNYLWGKKVVSWCGYDILLLEAPAPDIIWYHLRWRRPNGNIELLNKWVFLSPLPMLLPPPPSSRLCFFLPTLFHSHVWGVCTGSCFGWHLLEGHWNSTLTHATHREGIST